MIRYYFRNNTDLQENVLSYYKTEKDLNILSEKFLIPKKPIAEFLKRSGVRNSSRKSTKSYKKL